MQHFEGSLDDAAREAILRNARNHLAMTHAEKMEAAWQMVLLAKHTKREIAEAAGIGERSVATMRSTLGELRNRHVVQCWETWAEAKRSLKGEERRDFDEEAKEAMAREWAIRLGKTFGRRGHRQAEVLARALELYSKDLPRGLIEYWADIAREAVADLDEEA